MESALPDGGASFRSGLAFRELNRESRETNVTEAQLLGSLRVMRDLQRLSSAKAALSGVETFRATRRADFHDCEPGVLNKVRFVRNLCDDIVT